MTVETGDVQLVRAAGGLLAAFNRAGVLAAADVHVATRLGRLGGEENESVLLAAALAVRSARLGSVCLDIADVRATTVVEGESLDDLAWPGTDAWIADLEESPLVAQGDSDAARPLRLVDGVMYLDRYWREEQLVATAVDAATARTSPAVDSERMRAALTRLFGSDAADRQRLAAVVASNSWFSVIAGGPGTGKTTTVARLVALLRDQPGATLRIALAAPTGRAAARLKEAVTDAAERLDPVDRERIGALEASTLHRLLGWKPGSRTRFRHDATNPLPFDVVIVDEASMVSLTMMARLLEALREHTRLVLVGDPDQLASVEVGAVLGDLVRRAAPSAGESATIEALARTDLDSLDESERDSALASGVVRLSHVYRFSGEVEQLAQGVRAGDQDAVLALLDDDARAVELVDTGSGGLRTDIVGTARDVVSAARTGDGDGAVEALARHRLLCAHREGPYGVGRWSVQVEDWLRAEIEGYGHEGFWYVGRPLLVTANDYQLRLFNGDTGVVIDVDGEPRAAFRRDGRVEMLPTGRLGEVQTMHAMSVHRSQGSQFGRVTLVLPPVDSPLLTRELLYTAVTRATEHVRIIGTREALAQAIVRPIVRASGLRTRRS